MVDTLVGQGRLGWGFSFAVEMVDGGPGKCAHLRRRGEAVESNLSLSAFTPTATSLRSTAGRNGGGGEERGSGSWCNAVQVRRDEMAGDFEFV